MLTFYHADRSKTLQAGQVLEVNERGLSRFGETYWSSIHNTPVENMDAATLREHCAEIACQRTNHGWSRHCSLFAAETIEQAIEFALAVTPRPDQPIPIFEIHAFRASEHDMNWLDFDVGLDQRIDYAERYWRMERTNHQPQSGERRPPRFEIIIPLPATVGEQVATVLL